MDGVVLTQTWSIGGPYPGSILSILGGQPQGISYSHNKYEGDSSACRVSASHPPCYCTRLQIQSDACNINNGDAHSLILSKFQHLYNLGDTYTLDSLHEQNLYNQQISKSTNPYYFSVPFSGVLVAPAAHNFIINFMSNHSADQPDGYLEKSQLKAVFGISGPDNQLRWNKGQEKIPQDWYRRPTTNPYTVEAAILDVMIGVQMYPPTFKVGGNTGTVNSIRRRHRQPDWRHLKPCKPASRYGPRMLGNSSHASRAAGHVDGLFERHYTCVEVDESVYDTGFGEFRVSTFSGV
jgi:hypothetical protein